MMVGKELHLFAFEYHKQQNMKTKKKEKLVIK